MFSRSWPWRRQRASWRGQAPKHAYDPMHGRWLLRPVMACQRPCAAGFRHGSGSGSSANVLGVRRMSQEQRGLRRLRSVPGERGALAAPRRPLRSQRARPAALAPGARCARAASSCGRRGARSGWRRPWSRTASCWPSCSRPLHETIHRTAFRRRRAERRDRMGCGVALVLPPGVLPRLPLRSPSPYPGSRCAIPSWPPQAGYACRAIYGTSRGCPTGASGS